MSLKSYIKISLVKDKKDCFLIFKNYFVMKKLLVIALIAMSGVTSLFANELTDYEVLNKVSNESTFKTMVRYLNLDDEQADQMKYIFRLTERKFAVAAEKNSDVAADKAVMFNLGNAKAIMSSEQYRKYLIVLNVSKYYFNDGQEVDFN